MMPVGEVAGGFAALEFDQGGGAFLKFGIDVGIGFGVEVGEAGGVVVPEVEGGRTLG